MIEFGMNGNHTTLLAQARLVASRLERLSPDSTWQRRASGIRGALLKLLEQSGEGELFSAHAEQLKLHIDSGYKIMESAARTQ